MNNEKIKVSYNKILKLTNVLIKEIDLIENSDINKEILQMENYIRNKGAQPVGPFIQYTRVDLNGNEVGKFVVKLLKQVNTFIHNVEVPYKMESVIRVKNCMYARYIGEESKLKYAYDKINLIAFEEDIPLKGDSYTVFVAKNDDNIVADVFMERADGE
ncbi:hypothetical protein [Acetivibrio clariflavus]|mgnify:CR=1 FL=1|uniref:Uncharacterized protein n=1 Tax=Acetivibrio clariflavus (strain DSM 19732 / NBRC 101661 / EBR45) TaxID=720554 RepID=G8LWE1_ACECE|nr:hypothetical protein [Acetivibrio clariflavus]AEV67567.1 hypothetical protein Clocl_0885 [Acetivibrio clariflavus DSM 19732]